MIPALYEKDETTFDTNGICRLPDIADGFVTEEINGVYECEFKYPVNGLHFSEIKEGRIIAVFHDDTKMIEPFDIYGRSVPINGLVTFYAHHVSYRLNRIVTFPFKATSCSQALSNMWSYTINDDDNLFSFYTDISANGELTIETPRTIKEILNDSEDSIYSTYGPGEFEWNKFQVKFLAHRGSDRDVSVRYGKNLSDYRHETDNSESYNAVVPFWRGHTYHDVQEDSGEIVIVDPEEIPLIDDPEPEKKTYRIDDGEFVKMLPFSEDSTPYVMVSANNHKKFVPNSSRSIVEGARKYVPSGSDSLELTDGQTYYVTETEEDKSVKDSFITSDDKTLYASYYSDISGIKAVPLDLSDYFEEEPTYEDMRELSLKILTDSRAWEMNESFDVEFEQLWESGEYETYASLQRVFLGDYVNVYNTQADTIKIKMEVVKTKYNFVLEKYQSMTIGNARESFAETLMSQTEQAISQLPKKSFMQAAIDYATNLIKGGLGGHVVLKTNDDGEPEEILIMDTDDTATAVNVWRFNLGGLGHSHSGYNGPFDDVALTMDGRINANMITAGILNANLMRAGVIQDATGRNYWNLETGEFNLSIGDDVGIGGTNLVPETGSMVTRYSGKWKILNGAIANGIATFNSGSPKYLTFSTGKKIGDYVGRYLTLSADFEYAGTPASSSFIEAQLIIQANDSTTVANDRGYVSAMFDISKLENNKVRCSVSFNPQKDGYFTWAQNGAYDNSLYMILRIQTSLANLSISRIKFELGNTPTDWSPAPEDGATKTDLAGKVDSAHIITAINASTEGVAISGDKISLQGKTIDLATDEVSIGTSNGSSSSTYLYFDPDDIVVDGMRPVHLGGTKGWLELGYTSEGVLRLQVGSYGIAITENGVSAFGPSGSRDLLVDNDSGDIPIVG